MMVWTADSETSQGKLFIKCWTICPLSLSQSREPCAIIYLVNGHHECFFPDPVPIFWKHVAGIKFFNCICAFVINWRKVEKDFQILVFISLFTYTQCLNSLQVWPASNWIHFLFSDMKGWKTPCWHLLGTRVSLLPEAANNNLMFHELHIVTIFASIHSEAAEQVLNPTIKVCTSAFLLRTPAEGTIQTRLHQQPLCWNYKPVNIFESMIVVD